MRQPQVVHDQAARLVAEDAVDAGDRLHQAVPAHGLVDIHGMQRRGVEARQPHVADDGDLKVVLGGAKALGQRLTLGLVADVRLPLFLVRRGAGHDDLHGPALVGGVDPSRAQCRDLLVQIDADAPAHADDHGLAFHRLQALLVVVDDVLGDELQALGRADDALHLRPLALELLLAVDFLAFGQLFELRVDAGLLGRLKFQLRQPALIVNRDGRLVLDGLLNVVNADVLAEHGAGVGVGLLDRGSRKSDERGVGQSVPHVAGKAVDEVVLASVRLVGDHHDVAAVREHGMAVSLLLRQELLDGGKHHPARADAQLLAQVRAVGGLDRGLAQKVLAARKSPEELVVQVVAVGEHDDGGVLHRGFADHAPRVEGHAEALAGALGVPDDADAAISRRSAVLLRLESAGFRHPIGAGGAQGLAHGDIDGVELMIARDLLDHRTAAGVLKDDEVFKKIQKPSLVEDALDHDLKLGELRVGQLLARDGTPGLKPLLAGAEGADAGLGPVRNHKQGVVGKERGNLALISLELLERGPDRGVLIGRVLQF